MPPVPRFDDLEPSSQAASNTKKRNPAKNTRPELALRRELWSLGGRYRLHVNDLPGKPDLVFVGARVVVFCDGDFWHGRDWSARRAKLETGSNGGYWVAKIESNIARDRKQEQELEAAGWQVIRLWESDILQDPRGKAGEVLELVRDSASREGARFS